VLANNRALRASQAAHFRLVVHRARLRRSEAENSAIDRTMLLARLLSDALQAMEETAALIEDDDRRIVEAARHTLDRLDLCLSRLHALARSGG
jgi:hypothetical protein